MINKNISAFNIRTYALIINNGNILLSNELVKGQEVIKFPGGGVEFGEGVLAALKREAMEEMNTELHHIEHFYTTDFFQQSQFKKTDQLISIYYTAQLYKFSYVFEDYKKPEKNKPVFFWKNITEMDSDILHFPIDKHVCSLIKEI